MSARDEFPLPEQGWSLEEKNRALNEIDRLLRQLVKERQDHAHTVQQRDRAEDWADRLANAIAPETDIGEHSNLNNPWANALRLVIEADRIAGLDRACCDDCRPTDEPDYHAPMCPRWQT